MSFESMTPPSGKGEAYEFLLQQFAALIGGERDFIANCANACALIMHSLLDLNWAGVYLLKGGELVVGPFQGKPACVRIAIGRGVCGTAAAQRRSIIVPDVHAFAGHIACDSASNSEIVVPLMRGCELIGVLDLDSPQLARFDAIDGEYLERFARLLMIGSD
jgi:L-methionine (R)-S-oxide reductase